MLKLFFSKSGLLRNSNVEILVVNTAVSKVVRYVTPAVELCLKSIVFCWERETSLYQSSHLFSWIVTRGEYEVWSVYGKTCSASTIFSCGLPLMPSSFLFLLQISLYVGHWPCCCHKRSFQRCVFRPEVYIRYLESFSCRKLTNDSVGHFRLSIHGGDMRTNFSPRRCQQLWSLWENQPIL